MCRMAGDPTNEGHALATGPLVPMGLLLCALSYATDSQGAFYPGPFHVFVILVALALVAGAVVTRERARVWLGQVGRDPLVWTVAALAVVTVLSAVVAGQASNAIGPVALLFMMAAVVAVVTSLPAEHRRLLVAGVVAISVVVAAIGWVAVLARWQPNALTSQGLWRAASTLTYENALAAFLTAPALLCLDRLMTGTARRTAWALSAYVVLLGIGASLSRGGFLGLVVGVVVLVAWRGPARLPTVAGPVLGSLIGLAGLAPSFPVSGPARVAPAVVGLVVGALMAAWNVGEGSTIGGDERDERRTTGWRRARVAAALVGTAVLIGLVAAVSSRNVAHQIAQARFSAASSDRAHEWSAAWAVARQHLVLGVGTARVLLQWQEGTRVFTATFAHNEFLQLVVQDGFIGLAVLLIGLICIVRRLLRLRGRGSAWSVECASACLLALLVQSSLDFLWHLTVIPVLLAVVLATALTPAGPAKDLAGPSKDTGKTPLKSSVDERSDNR
jgi:O-antigen ligase/polysaccharide polymerase Wzy-like membrane protein